jgi:hypothetical protein
MHASIQGGKYRFIETKQCLISRDPQWAESARRPLWREQARNGKGQRDGERRSIRPPSRAGGKTAGGENGSVQKAHHGVRMRRQDRVQKNSWPT